MSLRILIAEDSATNRLLFSTTLQRLGYAATLAANGQEALGLFLRHAYDLVLLDLHMPVMDGISTALEIQKVNAACTPVYAVSGFAAPELEDRFAEAGIVRCLVKPLTRESLAAVAAECGLGGAAAAALTALPEGVSLRVAASYMQELWSRGQACPRLLKSGDMQGLLREAHTIAGLAHMLNTPVLVDAARQVEAAVASRDTAAVAAAAQALSGCCLKVSQHLKARLNAATA